jgi:methionyl-tRNA formyltransferase
LKALLGSPRHQVVAVVTAPDKPAGRSMKLSSPPVKQEFGAVGIPLLQPDDLSDPFFLRAVQGFAADVAAVVAFRILPTELFTLPRLGCVNLHASLLPALRGAAPIQWALMNGMSKTGVTTFLIERKVDTGGILKQSEIDILPDDDAGSLSGRLSVVGAKLLLESLDALEAGRITPMKQIGSPTLAPKITRETCLIDWNRSALDIHNQIRGLAPEPAAFTLVNGKLLKIFSTKVIDAKPGIPGEIVGVDKSGITVRCGFDGISLEQVQLEGRKRVSIVDFLRGYPLETGTRLGV